MASGCTRRRVSPEQRQQAVDQERQAQQEPVGSPVMAVSRASGQEAQEQVVQQVSDGSSSRRHRSDSEKARRREARKRKR